MSDVRIRLAATDDYPAILGILGYFIEHSNASWRYATPGQDWLQGFAATHNRPERPVFVAEIGDQVVGYSCLSDFRSMDGYWPCAENSVYVLPAYQNQQIGNRLLETLLEAAAKTKLHKIIAAIDGGNESSIRFHKRFGFEICGQLKDIGFKNGQWLSLVLMVLDLKQTDTKEN